MPQYTSGRGYGSAGSPFGTNVAPVAMPNPSADLAKQFPNLAGANAGVSDVINNQLKGVLNPDTLDMIKNQGAAWGVGSGMPGSQLAGNNALRNLGLTSIGQQQAGVKNFNDTLPTVSSTETVRPETQADINLQNNVNAAAPNPAAAASYAQNLFQQYLSKLNPQNNSSPTYSIQNVRGTGTSLPFIPSA